MTREARAVIVGVPHHITQRSNNRQDVFFVDDWLGAMRNATFRGHALGSDAFISKIETRIGRRLRPAPVGRPKTKASAKRRAKRRRK